MRPCPRLMRKPRKSRGNVKIVHIHRSTGHGSIENLVKALQDRGAKQHVIDIAKKWKCPSCDKYKRTNPRRFATLSPIPQKWERIQADVATWMHPRTKKNHHILLVIDEGSRFRIGRQVASGDGNQCTWLDLKRVLEENWFSVHMEFKLIRQVLGYQTLPPTT